MARFELTLAQLEKQARYVTRQGQEWRTVCPFHHGHNPTALSVSLESGLYHCFVCGAKGKLLDYWNGGLALSPPVAIQPSKYSPNLQAKPRPSEKVSSTATPASSMTKLLKFCQSQLAVTASQQYLETRSITLATAQKFGLGYHPHWRFVVLPKAKPAANGSFEVEPDQNRVNEAPELEAARTLERKPEFAFHPAIIFPTYGPQGLLNLYARAITPDCRLHHIPSGKRGIFNYPALLTATEQQPTFVVEGGFDALAMLEADCPNVVAVIGVSFEVEWFRRHPHLILALDNDQAGQAAQLRLVAQFQKQLNYQPRLLPPDLWRGYKDFNQFWQQYGRPNHICINWSEVVARCKVGVRVGGGQSHLAA